MLDFKVLVLKLLPVDRLAAGAVARGKVTALDHEPVGRLDDHWGAPWLTARTP